MRRYFQTVVFLSAVLALGNVAAPQSAARRKIVRISYGDYLVTGPELSSKAGIEQSFRRLRDEGFTNIYWRMLTEDHPLDGLDLYPHPTVLSGRYRG